ncbi:Gfo/Idh/MocA family protein [Streptomyces sp. NPDC048419]|uniref:Gfo/Idh/MocA family protein n=1 Tax=Streptomyces sp. NPDC048419 TaxID=3365547 RepID=UPI0037132204
MNTSSLQNPFRLGLVGAGRMGQTHLRALTDSPTVRITDIADPMAQTRERFARGGFNTHPSVDDLLSYGGVDGLLIAAPTGNHLQLIRAAATAGIPVLCEKPAGLTSGQIREAGQIAAQHRIAFQVAYWRRFVPDLLALREQIRSGALGEIHLIIGFQWDEHPPSQAFRAGSGGIFIDMGVHEFDMIRWLTGQQITYASAVCADPAGRTRASHDCDSAQVLMRLSDGSTALVSLGRFFPRGDMVEVETFGRLDHSRITVIDPTHGEGAMLDALRRQAEAFAAYATSGRPSGANTEDALAALLAAEEATQSIQHIQAEDR